MAMLALPGPHRFRRMIRHSSDVRWCQLWVSAQLRPTYCDAALFRTSLLQIRSVFLSYRRAARRSQWCHSLRA